jgi:hypothetical protein
MRGAMKDGGDGVKVDKNFSDTAGLRGKALEAGSHATGMLNVNDSIAAGLPDILVRDAVEGTEDGEAGDLRRKRNRELGEGSEAAMGQDAAEASQAQPSGQEGLGDDAGSVDMRRRQCVTELFGEADIKLGRSEAVAEANHNMVGGLGGRLAARAKV